VRRRRFVTTAPNARGMGGAGIGSGRSHKALGSLRTRWVGVVGNDFELDWQIERADLDGCLAGASVWYQRAGAAPSSLFFCPDRIEAAGTWKGQMKDGRAGDCQ
jgi:hypothetical protein